MSLGESFILEKSVNAPMTESRSLSCDFPLRIGTPTLNPPFSSPIPWRRPGVRHSSSEIFFDFAESLSVTLDRKGGVVKDDRWGSLECNARLSGVPDVSLHLGGGTIKGQGLHPCVRSVRSFLGLLSSSRRLFSGSTAEG